MLAKINNIETLERCLNTPTMEIISRDTDIFGTLYVKESAEPGCVDFYDFEGKYIFFASRDEAIEECKLYAKFDHHADYMSDYQYESLYFWMDKSECEQQCLSEYLDLYEGVELCEELDEDDEF